MPSKQNMVKDVSNVLCTMNFLCGSESRGGLTNHAYCGFNINIILICPEPTNNLLHTILHDSGGRHGA